MGIFDWLFGKKKAEPAAAPQVNEEKPVSDPERFRRIMTSQVLAMYLYDHDEACREEYLRRLKICGLSEERARQYMAFETEILNRCPRPEMVDKNRKLFLPYAQNMVDALGWSYQEVNKFSFNEQGMLDLYRWNRGMTRAAKQPWGIA